MTAPAQHHKACSDKGLLSGYEKRAVIAELAILEVRRDVGIKIVAGMVIFSQSKLALGLVEPGPDEIMAL